MNGDAWCPQFYAPERIRLVARRTGRSAGAPVEQLPDAELPTGRTAEPHVDQLRAVLEKNPPPWLAKIMGKAAEERVLFEREEEEVL